MKDKFGLCVLRSRMRTIAILQSCKRGIFISVVGRFFQINVTDGWEIILKILTAGQFFEFFNFSSEPSIAISLALTKR